MSNKKSISPTPNKKNKYHDEENLFHELSNNPGILDEILNTNYSENKNKIENTNNNINSNNKRKIEYESEGETIKEDDSSEEENLTKGKKKSQKVRK